MLKMNKKRKSQQRSRNYNKETSRKSKIVKYT